jgi:hypothetical protein
VPWRSRVPLPAALLSTLLLAGAELRAQADAAQPSCWSPLPSLSPPDSVRIRRAHARRIEEAARLESTPPQIDALLDEPAWCAVPPATDFVQSRPNPGGMATLPTVARVLYDAEAIYVAVRLFDPHPDSIVAPYPRRDDETTSDWLFVEIDSRFDRRTGFSFGVNPRGVQVDGSWWGDVNYDAAWNAVWESAARIDSLGWTAEYRIPFSQLPLARSVPGEPLVWGINFYRHSPHRGETSNWAPRLPTVVGVVSHFNELRGLTVPPRRAGLELVPYTAVSGSRRAAGQVPGPMSNDLSATAGGDLRFRPTPSTTVAVSVHPDFGQVEADPSQINLTTFETFLPEQRPLFVEGADVFQFNSALTFSTRGTSFDQESPFYSRRIGRPPHLGCPEGAADCRAPTTTTVLAAARASTRTAGGWSGGLFHAWTSAEHTSFLDTLGARHRAVSEPLTTFTVARGLREFNDGRSALGVMGTFVRRLGMDTSADSALARQALVLGAEGRTRFASDGYEATGFALVSRARGSTPAIAALRREPRHGYGRPSALDVPAPVDPPHGALSGLSAQVQLARIDGRLQWGVATRLVSRGFEANDAGFERNADWIIVAANWKYQVFRPGHFIRRWSVGSSQLGVGWTFEGERRAAVANLTVSVDLHNYWGGSLSLDHELAAQDPEILRGGPAFRLPGRDRWALNAYTDTRRRWQLTLDVAGARERATGSAEATLSPSLSAFVTDRLQLGLTPSAGFVVAGWQYVGQPRDSSGRAHYVLGSLHQTTASLTTRVTYAFSAHVTLQLYAQTFLSGGRYHAFKEVTAPAAADARDRVTGLEPRLRYDAPATRYVVDGALPTEFGFDDPAFSDRELHLNLLLRWEFLPGSTIFLVWTQERFSDGVSGFDIGRDLHRLWRAPANNVLLMKLSYWIGERHG